MCAYVYKCTYVHYLHDVMLNMIVDKAIVLTQCCGVAVRKRVAAETHQKAGLAHTSTPNDEYLV